MITRKINDVEIKFRYSFLLAFGMYYGCFYALFSVYSLNIGTQLLCSLIGMVFVTLLQFFHEVAHITVAKRYYVKLYEIEISFAGIRLDVSDNLSDYPKGEFLISIAGLVFSLIAELFIFILIFLLDNSVLGYILRVVFLLQGLSILYNLLPLHGSDGAQAIEKLIHWISGSAGLGRLVRYFVFALIILVFIGAGPEIFESFFKSLNYVLYSM